MSSNILLKNVFADNQVVLSQCQPKNILSLLSKAKFETETESNTDQNMDVFKRNRNSCKICKFYLQRRDSFETSLNVTWKVRCKITYCSKNVIYCSGQGCNRFDNHVFFVHEGESN